MGKVAFLYAGQGSQHKGMGKDLYDTFPEYKDFMDSLMLDFDVKKISFEDQKGLLVQTEYTQPCMVAFACGINEILRIRQVKPDYVCGLSLGEYSALNMAEVWDAQETIQIAAYRGKVMAQASKGIETAMFAIIGLNEKQVLECCADAAEYGMVSISNINCPGQIVIGGEKTAVEKASVLAKKVGAKSCLPLNVSGPFHTQFMKSAGNALATYFRSVDFKKPVTEVLYNYLGGPLANGSIADVLVQQVQKTVRMEDILSYLFEHGVTNFVEIGPGAVLSGFARKTAKALGMSLENYEFISLETVEDINHFLREGFRK